MPEWLDSFENEAITYENRESFNSAMGKYATENDAIVGGFNAQKMAGKPFKVPESIDKLPDDATRTEFTTQARKALGINIPKDVESIKDVNFNAGLAEGKVADENFVGIIKKWAVESGIDTATLNKLSEFYNGPLTKYAQAAIAAKEEAGFKVRSQKGNETLLAHYNGDAAKLAEDTELLRRVFQNHAGLSEEEYENISDELVDSKWNTHPVINKALMNLLPRLSKEGTTTTGDGAGGGEDDALKPSPYEAKKARWPKSSGEWGKPTDKWDDEDIETRKAFGSKKSVYEKKEVSK